MQRKPVEDWVKKIDTVCLGDWASAYLDSVKPRFSKGTYDEKRKVFQRFFKDVSPTLPVTKLKPGDVMSYVVKQKEERSGYSANKDRKNLVAAWNWGMKYMKTPLSGPNPCLVERMPEVRSPRYVPPEEDFWKVFEAAEGQDRVMLLAFLYLAARRGEIFRLKWDDVDFTNNRVRLWTCKRTDGTYEYDWLPMTGELRDALRWWWEHRPVKDQPNVFLCLDEPHSTKAFYGEPFRYRLQFMRRLCDKAGVKQFGFHAIRHLSASILFQKGYELGVIQAILRHQSPSTTERYLKSIGMERVREALEDLSREKGKVLEFKKPAPKIAVAGLTK